VIEIGESGFKVKLTKDQLGELQLYNMICFPKFNHHPERW